jgi:hypothetical protein
MTQDAQVPAKKGLPTLAWIGIGCAVLIVIVLAVLLAGGIFMAKKVQDVAGDLDFEGDPAMSAAKLVVRMNPELEEVEVDEAAGTITVRHTPTGKTMTLDIHDLKEGRIQFSTDEGDVVIDAGGSFEDGTIDVTSGDESWTLKTGAETGDDLPGWVPLLAGSAVENAHEMVTNEGTSGGFQMQTDQPVAEVVEHYRSGLEGAGFEVHVNSFAADGSDQGAVVSANDEAAGRAITIMVRAEEDGSTNVAVSYQEGTP